VKAIATTVTNGIAGSRKSKDRADGAEHEHGGALILPRAGSQDFGVQVLIKMQPR
jgi:hypothetical protein